MIKCFKYRVLGLVQGVFFRKYTAAEATKLGLNGFVQNMPDRSVYCEVEGDPVQLKEFEKWLQKGSPLSIVSDVHIEEKEPANFTKFEIRYPS